LIQYKLYRHVKELIPAGLFFFIFITGCEDPSSSNSVDAPVPTLEQSSLGGKEGEVQSYFFNFNKDINSKFLYYPNTSKISTPSTMDPLKDTLNLRTFSDYLFSISRADFIREATRLPFNEADSNWDINGDGIYSQDIIRDLNKIVKIDWSEQHKPIAYYSWNEDGNGKYEAQRQSEVIKISDTLIYSQLESFGTTYDSLIFKSVIDSNVTSVGELTFVDLDEFSKKVVEIPTGEKVSINDTIYYEERYLEETSLLKLKSADCNDDGQISSKEERVDSAGECIDSVYLEDGTGGFCDRGNGKFDDSEVYMDINEDNVCNVGVYENAWKDGAEPFQDRNCNNKYDQAESRVISADECIDSVYLEDDTGGFCDRGNGIWDEEEWPDLSHDLTNIVFLNIDLNGSYMDTLRSNWEQNEPFFKITSRLDNLIIDYQDINNPDPVPLENVYFEVADSSGNTIINIPNSIIIKAGTLTGWNFIETTSLISARQAMAIKSETFEEIEKYETTYSNVVIEQAESYCSNSNYKTEEECNIAEYEWIPVGDGEEYFIMKSRWSANDTILYDYHAFRDRMNGDVVKLFHPYYFKHYGYIADNIWFDNDVYEEVFLYTKGGYLRDGERVSHDTLITTPTGDYNVRTEYEIDSDTISVPYTLWEMVNGQVVCKDNNTPVDHFTECPEAKVDQLIDDCFKITRTRTLTLIANGVEYGQKNTEWLAKDLGIVKSLYEIRWSEAVWDQGEKWTSIGKWELMDSKQSDLGRLFVDRISRIKPSDLEYIDRFDREPYMRNPLFGLHRLQLQNINNLDR